MLESKFSQWISTSSESLCFYNKQFSRYLIVQVIWNLKFLGLLSDFYEVTVMHVVL